MKTSAILAALLLLVCGYFYLQVDWEARAIRQQLKQVVDLVEKDGAVSTLEAMGRSRQLTAVLTSDAKIEYLTGRSFPKGADALGRAFLAAWSQVNTANVSILKHEVDISENYPEAKSRVTANCRVLLDGQEVLRDTVRYQIYWKKQEGDWLIREVVALGGL
ncbi:hypothetical protein SH580_03625 [Coraliomargarita algicola]|uniref:SnoaL-like domain-containing protein n=1 Tax=Coraliomargarita algicola TaxID=3092156 RepID=A0ABZ0RNU5_9BACT|nr:hypothetical protein [Coraliomargarita sp. J2-16]WPJ96793.1 hypothetical protein SH580_03625 [Coraliomargarita sp. J2-16]